jgi:UDP-3-O-[3-hydroxymyristoyl] N-acetylglucosamine deacetylase
MQQTLKNVISITGIGLHSGQDISLSVRPAQVDNGIVFVRTDVNGKDNLIPALWDHVVDTQLCTVIGNEDGITVGTIEHLMAALRGCGIDNAVVELDGAEVPIMDGSSAPFIALIEEAGIAQQAMPRRAIKILKEIVIEEGGKRAALKPANGSIFGGEINFDHPEIGHQEMEIQLVNGNFKHDLADARTFGFLHEVEYMRSNGLALGGSLDNAIVLDKQTVMNESGLRFKDEFIRHKLLDAVGDLYLAGGQIVGAYECSKPGHALNNKILHALFADPTAWEYVDLYEDAAAKPAFVEENPLREHIWA